MASPTPKSGRAAPQPPAQFETVNPGWLLKALAAALLVALTCAYLSFCFLFYQGQWQLVLHPARTSEAPQSIAGIPYELIHFGPDETATPQLSGWWIPSATNGRYAQSTILFLGGSDGSVAGSIPTLAALHNLGISVFAFDYRGYGQSAATHPSQQNMTHDADAAWQYLNTSRHIPEQQIIPYGTGVGASLAATLAATHPSTPAAVLDSPHADLLNDALHDPRTRLLPVRLLFHERFPLAEPLATLRTPKLLIQRSSTPNRAFQTASKFTVELAAPSETLFTQTLTRFFAQYLPGTTAPQLVPTPAPTSQNPR